MTAGSTYIGPNYVVGMGLTGIWLGQTVGPLAIRLGFNPTACTGFLKPIFFGGMDILLTLDTGGGP